MTPMKTLAAVATLVVAASAHAETTTWNIDPAHSAAQFSVKHLMVSTVRGQFNSMKGTVKLDEQDMTRSQIDISIDATSIDTREPKRDDHLRSPDFFDVEKNPTLTFRSTKIESAGAGTYKVTGDFTMRGVTHPVTLVVEGPTPAVKNPWGRTVRGVSATGTLNRKDWGLNWNKALEAGGVLVGEEIKLQVDAELDLEEAPAAATPASAPKAGGK